ncbi:glycosyltransferase family 4 protein [Alkalihalobacterium chitinilyticum]|uniref:Glycosyltransferase n=1 Tax=Alkalihalobacterium chitinilyticum TaxID=2980103 RepID=A0ABT5VD49_9BACI|nr:glycosyltransferase [Alkalihalobacterium chitinilyticum]MDE5412662.1 glycosyltransferase [Alkalihalobacterium chitinilyticum]
MRVLIICTEKLPVPPVRGGAIQTYIAGAVPFLSKKHEITILGRNDESLPDKETKEGIHYVRIPGGLLETYRQGVVDYLKSSSKFDLIHIFNRPRLVAPVRECVPNARIILSMHNDMFKPQKIDYEEGILAIEEVDKIITISNYIGEEITKLFPQAESKLKTIYSGVDLEQFVPISSSKAKKIRKKIRNENNLKGKKVILFAGRLSANKGADVLIKAMNTLAKKHSNIALVLMGSKWFSDNRITDYIAFVRTLAERSPVPVITTGFVTPDKIHEWFAAADIFVCPSQWQEPLARVHYEAMATGLPIVTTARGGNPEVIEVNKNGLIVEKPRDPEQFADHLSDLLSNPEKCKEMGKYGRKLAEEKYSWNRVVTDILGVWSEVETGVSVDRTLNNAEKPIVDEVHQEKEEVDVKPNLKKKRLVVRITKGKEKGKVIELEKEEIQGNVKTEELKEAQLDGKTNKAKELHRAGEEKERVLERLQIAEVVEADVAEAPIDDETDEMVKIEETEEFQKQEVEVKAIPQEEMIEDVETVETVETVAEASEVRVVEGIEEVDEPKEVESAETVEIVNTLEVEGTEKPDIAEVKMDLGLKELIAELIKIKEVNQLIDENGSKRD